MTQKKENPALAARGVPVVDFAGGTINPENNLIAVELQAQTSPGIGLTMAIKDTPRPDTAENGSFASTRFAERLAVRIRRSA
jgi:hypothetical protein